MKLLLTGLTLKSIQRELGITVQSKAIRALQIADADELNTATERLQCWLNRLLLHPRQNMINFCTLRWHEVVEWFGHVVAADTINR